MNTAIHRRLEALEKAAAINPHDASRPDLIYVVGVERDLETAGLFEAGEPVELWRRDEDAKNDQRNSPTT